MSLRKKRLIAGISLLAIGGIIIYLRSRHRTNIINRLKAEQVSEHGYETAADILFPRHKISRKDKYGPVLPRDY